VNENMIKVIIQIPCYNEEGTLGITVDALPKSLPGVDVLEYLVIDDGSKDRTVEVAREHGVHHIVSLGQNCGLASGFMAGLEACIEQGADIIVNTDADNQYCADDIEKLLVPIQNGEAEIVVGARPISETAHFSPIKKLLQHLGSWMVRIASGTDIPDAPSGFRAITRDAAMQLNVFNKYTYTLETIIQAGRKNIPITSVPIRTNEELRPSRLFKSIFSYVHRSMIVILRIFMVYRPFRFFMLLSSIPITLGSLIGMRFCWFYFVHGDGTGKIQSLILAALLLGLGALLFTVALLADLISVNRQLSEKLDWRMRKLELRLDDDKSETNSQGKSLTKSS
jgi:glycosyltransferase involved in cell wall biosynthesis